ncbi:MAG TPA: hypothetical protein VK745_19130 [Polyangiaceae bacterium]|jgi:hypothetical protein|nr:hypothetical protein [Polyangiaceae bacterium]
MKLVSKLSIVLLSLSFVTLLGTSVRSPLGPGSSDYAALVNQAEDSVRMVAGGGVHALGLPEARSQIEQLGKRPLVPLLSAWSALSVGRLGLLDGSSSIRLPWLILAGLLPLSVFFVLVERFGATTATGAACWLLFSPGFVTGALLAKSSALAVWSGWLVLAAYAVWRRERARRERRERLILCGVLALVCFGLSLGAVWVVPVLLLHALSSDGAQALRSAERGQLPVSTAALLVVAVLPLAVIVWDPLLWHADMPTLIRRVFEEEDAVRSVLPRLAPFVVPGLLAVCGLSALALRGLARRFATGEFRPRRDHAATGLLVALGLLGGGLCWTLGVSSGSEFALELIRPFLACLVALGAAALASRFAARRARWAELALVALALLVR